MNTRSENTDHLIETYLRSVESGLYGVPEAQRSELLADLREHIATERAALSAETETEAAVRQIVERLGSPDTVAEAARANARPALAGARPADRRRRALIVTVSVLAVLAVLFGVTLVLGLALVSTSSNGPG